MNSIVVIENDTARRAMVIARRTGNDVVGMIKAQQIDLLKEKMRNGVAHFIFYKKDGTLREAWGTCAPSLMGNKVNHFINRDYYQNVVVYFDVEAGDFRCFKFENLVKMF